MGQFKDGRPFFIDYDRYGQFKYQNEDYKGKLNEYISLQKHISNVKLNRAKIDLFFRELSRRLLTCGRRLICEDGFNKWYGYEYELEIE